MRLCLVVAAAVIALSAVAGFAQPLPLEAYSQSPEVTELRLSPNGKRIAYLASVGDDTVLVAKDLASGKETPLTKADNRVFNFRWIEWANDEWVVFGAQYPDIRPGARTMETRLLSVNASNPKQINMLLASRLLPVWAVNQLQDDVVSLLRDEENNILVNTALTGDRHATLYKVDVRNGNYAKVMEGRPLVHGWLVDRQDRVRVALRYGTQSTKQSALIHQRASDRWLEAWEHEAFSAAAVAPLGFGLDPDQLYVRAYHKGRASIFVVDVSDDALPMKLVAHDDNYDIDGGLIYSPKNNDVVGVSNGLVQRHIYWNNDYRDFQAVVDKALPDTTNQVIGFSRDERRFLVLASSGTVPGTYYFGDRDQRSLIPVIETYPRLQGRLGNKKRIHYTARDGKTIEAYLTLPAGAKIDAPMPAVIFPHGGPMARNYGGFDPWVEFLASRGLAVLQPDFRGSTGYGWEFEMAALQNYGGTMQDDLTDAAHWLISQRIARPDRIGIVGASYGGYAALMGAVKTPELFRCAISFAGISDLAALRDQYDWFVNEKAVEKQIGSDDAVLRKSSPYHQVERIRIPILLVHGDQDRVVPVEQSRKMAKALHKSDKSVVYLELEDGSHTLDLQSHRHELFKAMDVFLRQHLLAEPAVASAQ